MRQTLTDIKEIFLDLLFPPRCLHCGTGLEKSEKESWLCFSCENNIIIHTTLFCSVCGARLPENRKICHKNSAYLLAAATKYDGPVRSVIRQLKYRGWPSLSLKIRRYLEKYVKNSGLTANNHLVIPIPLHPSRLKERGFNQAELLAVEIADILGLKMEPGILSRTKKTEAQAEQKDYDKRKINIAGAFEIKNPKLIAGKNIVLVDDVFTSGATMNEAVRTLKSAEAKKIITFVLAKTR